MSGPTRTNSSPTKEATSLAITTTTTTKTTPLLLGSNSSSFSTTTTTTPTTPTTTPGCTGNLSNASISQPAAVSTTTPSAATTTTATTSCSSTSSSRNKFPMKLYFLLEQAPLQKFESIVSWDIDGKSFCFHRPQQFEQELLTTFFPHQSKFRSLERMMNLWGFQRLRRLPVRERDSSWSLSSSCPATKGRTARSSTLSKTASTTNTTATDTGTTTASSKTLHDSICNTNTNNDHDKDEIHTDHKNENEIVVDNDDKEYDDNDDDNNNSNVHQCTTTTTTATATATTFTESHTPTMDSQHQLQQQTTAITCSNSQNTLRAYSYPSQPKRYYHPYFIRGKINWCCTKIHRQPTKGLSIRHPLAPSIQIKLKKIPQWAQSNALKLVVAAPSSSSHSMQSHCSINNTNLSNGINPKKRQTQVMQQQTQQQSQQQNPAQWHPTIGSTIPTATVPPSWNNPFRATGHWNTFQGFIPTHPKWTWFPQTQLPTTSSTSTSFPLRTNAYPQVHDTHFRPFHSSLKHQSHGVPSPLATCPTSGGSSIVRSARESSVSSSSCSSSSSSSSSLSCWHNQQDKGNKRNSHKKESNCTSSSSSSHSASTTSSTSFVTTRTRKQALSDSNANPVIPVVLSSSKKIPLLGLGRCYGYRQRLLSSSFPSFSSEDRLGRSNSADSDGSEGD